MAAAGGRTREPRRTPKAKLAVPALPRSLVSRPALERRLDETFGARLTLVVAGAGSGKSTLLAAWAADVECAWYTVDAHDAALPVLARGLVDAIALRLAGLPDELVAAVAAAAAAPGGSELLSAEALAALLSEALQDLLGHDLVLVLDDVHELGDAAASARLLEMLCRQAPERFHLVLCSRAEPPFPIARLRGQGLVVELDGRALSFGVEEIAALLSGSLDEEAAALGEDLYRATGGWPAGVRLAVEALRAVPAGSERTRALERLGLPGGPLFSYLTEEVFAGEAPEVRRLLRTVVPLERFTPALCEALGLPEAAETLAGLARRGLFVEEHGAWFSLHALVREFALRAWEVTPEEAREVHRRAAAWLEAHGELDDALESLAAAAEYEQLARVLSRRGAELLAAGSAARVVRFAELLPQHLRGAAIEALLGEAYAIRGEPERALEAIGRATVGTELLDPAVAWRLVQAYHLRDELEQAVSVYGRTRTDAADTLDEALLCAWTASAHRRLADLEACRTFARRALAAATACGDDRALAAAHTAASFAAEPDRHACRRHLQHALEAAERAGDVLQIIRIRNNRGSLLLEESDYPAAIEELERAMGLADAVGFAGLRALTLMNRGLASWCLGRLDEASADYEAAVEIYRPTGTQEISYALIGLGDVHRERGHLALARAAYEEGLALAERSGDRQGIVPGLYQLAKVLVDDQPERAAQLAERAVSYGWPDRAWALNATGWIALVRGDRERAGKAAERAGAVAREAGDRFGLAESLELQALSALDPVEKGQALEEALAIWRALGNGVHEAAVELALARLAPGLDARLDAERALRRLRSAGVRLGASGPAGLLRFLAREPAAPVAIETLGAFRILRQGRPVALAEWQSRKARDLLKLLVARRGRPTSRELLIEALWPKEDPRRPARRLSVALSVLRAVLDPAKRFPADHFVAASTDALRLVPDDLDVDVETFLHEASSGLALRAAGRAAEAAERLEHAEAAYAGEFLEEDRYEEWATPLREEARALYVAVARALAEDAAAGGDHEAAARYLLRILERDAYDEDAHLRLVASLAASGRHGEAGRAYRAYCARMEEIGVESVPLAAAAAPP